MSHGMPLGYVLLLLVGFFLIAAIIVKEWERRLKAKAKQDGQQEQK